MPEFLSTGVDLGTHLVIYIRSGNDHGCRDTEVEIYTFTFQIVNKVANLVAVTAGGSVRVGI